MITTKLHEDFFRPFFGAQHLNLITVIAFRMLEFGLTPADVVELAAMERKRLMATTPTYGPVPPALSCPDCGEPLRLSPVNVSRCTNVGGDWKTSLLCGNPICRYSDLSPLTFRELLEKRHVR